MQLPVQVWPSLRICQITQDISSEETTELETSVLKIQASFSHGFLFWQIRGLVRESAKKKDIIYDDTSIWIPVSTDFWEILVRLLAKEFAMCTGIISMDRFLNAPVAAK